VPDAASPASPASHDRARGRCSELGAFLPGARAELAGAPAGALTGSRFAVKDLVDVAGWRTGAGNPDFLADAPVATRSAPVVTALLAAGADLVGKTVSDELAFSLSGTNAHYGTPVNPAAPGRVPGGSSSGSASAVAGGCAELAIGTDTGGSVRVPASYCGIFGFRPSHGMISSEGVVPLAPSFDTVGLLARDAATLERAWHALRAGAPGTARAARPDERAGPPRTLVCPPELARLLDADARAGFEDAVTRVARELDCRVVEREVVAPDDLERVLEAFRTIQMAEAWASHGAWIERRGPALGPGVAARFAAASQVDPRAADALRPILEQARTALGGALGRDELLAQPAASGAAPEIALRSAATDDLRRTTLLLTVLAGAAGAPVAALPAARASGSPLGVALVSVPGDDDRLAACAARAAAACGPAPAPFAPD